jgi:hypothetical protein
VFERATYALEEIVAAQNINEFNDLSQKNINCTTNCAIGFVGNIDIDIHLLV